MRVFSKHVLVIYLDFRFHNNIYFAIQKRDIYIYIYIWISAGSAPFPWPFPLEVVVSLVFPGPPELSGHGRCRALVLEVGECHRSLGGGATGRHATWRFRGLGR